MRDEIITYVIAGITIFIAYQQWKTNKDSHRLNLYEKRYSIYKALMTALYELLRESNISSKGLDQFNIDTNESVFIFNKDAANYIDDFRNKALRLHSVIKQLSNDKIPIGEKRDKLAEEAEKLNEWFNNQLQESKNKFMIYLKF